MNRELRVQLIAGVVCLAFLAGSVFFSTRVSASVGEHRLAFTQKVDRSDPPQVGLGIAMGAFRGLFVNILWMRANHLKDEGRYYEAMELSTAITKLQPRFPRVWAFHAWNMAYNISVTTQTREERWQWVQSGIRLLRDEGIVYNPDDVLVHRELAWIFLHKIGGWADDANRYYKQQLALEWATVLGEPPAPSPSVRTPEAATEAYIEWFRPVADAPDTLAAVIEKTPRVADLVEAIADATGNEQLGFNTLRRYEIARQTDTTGRGRAAENRFGERTRAFQDLYRDPAYAEAWDALLPHLRRRILVERYNMEPGRMLHYFRKYGPLDYRHHAAHAVYWAAKGVDGALARIEKRNERDFDIVNADRVVIQAIQDLWRSGQIYFNYIGALEGDPNALLATPNVFYADAYGRTVDEIIERSRYDRIMGTAAEGRGQIWSFYIHGYENFLKDVVRVFYRRGQTDLAEQYYTTLRTHERMNLNDPDRAFNFSKPLEEFIADQFEDFRAYSPHVAAGEVTAALEGAYLALAVGDDDLFRRQFFYARDFHRYYMDKQRRTVVVDQASGPKAVMNPSFRVHAGAVFAQFVAAIDIEEAAAVYFNAPEDLKRFAYDTLVDVMKGRVEQVALEAPDGSTLGFDALFPEPSGMTQWRAEIRAILEAQNAREMQLEMQ